MKFLLMAVEMDPAPNQLKSMMANKNKIIINDDRYIYDLIVLTQKSPEVIKL